MSTLTRAFTTASAALCALGASIIAPQAAQAATLPDIPAPSSLVHHCAPKQVVVIPGGAGTVPVAPDKAPLGHVTSPVGIRLGNQHNVDTTYVPYQSFGFAATSYPNAAADGYKKTSQTIARIQHDCPHSSISLVGYSLGSDIASHIINDAAHGRGVLDARRFASAALYANPYQGGNGAVQYPNKPDVNTGSLGQLPGGFGDQGGKVLEVCHSNDAVCTFPDKFRNIVKPSMSLDMLHGKVPLNLVREMSRHGIGGNVELAKGFIAHNGYGEPDFNAGVNWINSH